MINFLKQVEAGTFSGHFEVIRIFFGQIIMLSFPPHCTHRSQPSDVSVYGSFKSHCATAQGSWMRNNPGKIMSMYELPGIVKYAWHLASTPNNIINAFKKTGICSYNQNIFTVEGCAPSYVTDRPLMKNPELVAIVRSNVEKENEPQPETSGIYNAEQSILADIVEDSIPDLSSNDTATTFSPEIVRPVPKAPPKQGKAKRRTRKSTVLTDTPEKNALAEEQSNKKRKTEEISSKIKNKGRGTRRGKNQVKRKILQEKNENDDEEDSLPKL